MNERIRELALQAGGEFWQRLENDVVKQDAYISFDPPELLEKFAELIVRECIELNKQELAFNAFERMLNRYKEHFGVEE